MKRKKYNKFVINTLKMVIANIEIGKYVPSNVEFNADLQQLEEDMGVIKTERRTLILHFADKENR